MDQMRDALFARVFATLAGVKLIADQAARSRFLTIAEIETRVARANRTADRKPESP